MAQSAMLRGLADPECLGNGQLKFSDDTFRGSLYKALVRRDYSQKNVIYSELPIKFWDSKWDAMAKIAAISLDKVDCAMRRNPQAARDVVFADAGSRQEQEAVVQLQIAVGPCWLPNKVATMEANDLIQAIPEVFYREAEASKLGSAK
jgi:hypothetical protein